MDKDNLSERFQIIPIYNPKAVLTAWQMIHKGVEAVLKRAHDDMDMTLTLNKLLAGEWLLWICTLDGAYAGYVITQIQVMLTNPPSKTLVITHAYKKPGIPHETLMEAVQDLEEHARSQGCKSLTCYAIRPWDRFYREFGFEPTYTEYRKELKEDG